MNLNAALNQLSSGLQVFISELFLCLVELKIVFCVYDVFPFILCHSPVKFVAGDCWPRGPTLTTCPSLLSPGNSVELPMEVSTVEHMDTSGSSNCEASAPLPIRHPSGINAGPYKKQVYPLNSKRPEHLRMNLWHPAGLWTPGLLLFYRAPLKETIRIFLNWLTDTVKADHQLFTQRLPVSRPLKPSWLSLASTAWCR